MVTAQSTPFYYNNVFNGLLHAIVLQNERETRNQVAELQVLT
jgi:hypothetical protein